MARVDEDCTGSTPLTRNRFKEHFFLLLEIPLPPLAEQRRIVARIEELAVKIQEARTLQQQAVEEGEALVASVLSEVCARGLPEHRRKKNGSEESTSQLLERISVAKWSSQAQARKRKPTILPTPPDVPESWLVVEAGELQERGAIFDIQDGNHGSDYPRKTEFSDDGVPFVTAKQIDHGAVWIARAPRLPNDRAARLRIGFAKAGDVLLTHNASVGSVAIAPDDAGDFLIGTSVTYWRCNPEAIDRKYLYYFMRSEYFQGQLQFIMKQTTRNQVSVLKQVNLWICVPPLSEQRQIVAELDALQAEVDALKRLKAETAAELDALLPSILDRAFRGGL
jgi:type I restriction enzyme S subunit